MNIVKLTSVAITGDCFFRSGSIQMDSIRFGFYFGDSKSQEKWKNCGVVIEMIWIESVSITQDGVWTFVMVFFFNLLLLCWSAQNAVSTARGYIKFSTVKMRTQKISKKNFNHQFFIHFKRYIHETWFN